AARSIVEFEVFAAMLAVHQVRVLTGVERAAGTAQKGYQETVDVGGGFKIGRVAPLRVTQRVEAQIFGLHRHDLLEVRLVPIAAGGVLVGAAPNGVDEMKLGRERQ